MRATTTTTTTTGPPTTTTTTTSTTTTTTISSTGISFTTPGTYEWTVPPGVFAVSAVVVGAGGGGGALYGAAGAGGGGGGALCYANAIPVNPGERILVQVGAGGAGASFDDPAQLGNCCVVCDNYGNCEPGCGCSNHYGSSGGDSSFDFVVAHGGGGFQGVWMGPPPSGLSSGPAPGGSGGGVGTCFSGGSGSFDFAAGGAAGYAGNGGNGCSSPSTGCPGSAGSGGGGGGGVARGGGVGLRGIGASGAAGHTWAPEHLDGYPGSQIDASDPVVGGGGSGYGGTSYGGGDSGGVRILFAPGLTYPTGDRYASTGPGCGQFPSNTPPAGSYQASCDSCAVSGCVLSCFCLTSTGGRVPSTLDLPGCAFGPDISNQDGVLTCTPA